MKELPILFSAPMVRAILEGRKTQTRRVVKPQPDVVGGGCCGRFTSDDMRHGRLAKTIPCPYGQPGDRLWVRETHMRVPHPSEFGFTHDMLPHTWDACCAVAGTYLYRADPCSDLVADGRPWTPSIHMPRAASRITLEVTGVRVERLQDINEYDAIEEGVKPFMDGGFHIEHGTHYSASAANTFLSLWEAINGDGSVDANTWVWVVEFKRVEVTS